MAEKIKVTQTGSTIGRTKTQEDTLKAMGLGRIGKSKIYPKNPATVGSVKKVAHLVKVEEVK
ncbi:MAG: 50S ribosomal protein L30 [Rickettsiales bacterium]|jgi:large subunit ribosomal protein L30|nr:50S ribosomal protein L30 [Rickettsiales bacterium]